MNNHILLDTREHYFSLQNKGIFVRRKDNLGLWSNPEIITADAKGPFCVYADTPDITHLIYIASENNLSYAVRRCGKWKTYTLSRLNSEIHPKKFQIYPIDGRLNLLYTAEYNGENLLIHCILGNHAKPETVAKLNSPHFWICNKKVYFTDLKGNCICTDLSDEKPDTFIKLYDNAQNISVYPLDKGEITLFTRDNKLFVNNKEIIYDTRMEMPVLTESGKNLYIMWKSGGYVRYITSSNYGKTWSCPMRYMASGTEILLFSAEILGNSRLFYGYNTSYDLHLFSRPDIFRA